MVQSGFFDLVWFGFGFVVFVCLFLHSCFQALQQTKMQSSSKGSLKFLLKRILQCSVSLLVTLLVFFHSFKKQIL